MVRSCASARGSSWSRSRVPKVPLSSPSIEEPELPTAGNSFMAHQCDKGEREAIALTPLDRFLHRLGRRGLDEDFLKTLFAAVDLSQIAAMTCRVVCPSSLRTSSPGGSEIHLSV